MWVWLRAQARCAALALREWAALAERRRRLGGISRRMAELRWAMGILHWARKEPPGIICAYSIPARDKCRAGLAMWCSSARFSLRRLVTAWRRLLADQTPQAKACATCAAFAFIFL